MTRATNKYCYGGWLGCFPVSSGGVGPAGDYDTHATKVAAILGSSIDEGQDTNFPGTYTMWQGQRSGASTRPLLYMYTTPSCVTFYDALQDAAANNVDLINMSLSFQEGCDQNFDCAGANGAMVALRQAGVGLISAAGNAGWLYNTACTLSYPAVGFQGVAVANIFTANETLTFDNSPLAGDSSWGGEPVTSVNGGGGTASQVLIAAPGCRRLNARNPNNYQDALDPPGCGTSFAAPVISGLYADMLTENASLGWAREPGNIFATMLSFGDAIAATDALGTLRNKAGLSNNVGAGRIHAMVPNSSKMVGPWGWGQRAVDFNGSLTDYRFWVGNSATGRLSSSITQWKFGAMWWEIDPHAVADFDFEVYDMCVGTTNCSKPGDSGCSTTKIASQYDLDTRARFQLRGADVQNRCLQVHVYAYGAPQARRIYMTDWFHGGTPN